MNELISVIMATYNENEQDLHEAIESVLTQTYENFEFIIICDNPKNQLHRDILTEYSKNDQRIRVFYNDSNLGLAETLNKGVYLSKGYYVARMDADDISFPERFELQLAYMNNHPECDIIGTNRVDIDENSNLTGSETSYNVSDEDIESVMRYGSVVVHPSVMMKKDVLVSLGGYRNFRAAQDYDLWLRALSSGCKIHIMQEKLLRYRIRSESISKVNFARQYFYTKYAFDLYKMRKKNNGIDNYSEENTIKYLDKCGLNNVKYVQGLNHLYEDFLSAFKSKNLKTAFTVGIRTIIYPEMINIITRSIKFKVCLKRFSKIK